MPPPPPASPSPSHTPTHHHEFSWSDFVFELDWASTLLLTAFMVVDVTFLRRIVGPVGMLWLKNWFWVVLLIYLAIQLWGTLIRDSTQLAKFLIDNGLAIGGIVVAAIIMTSTGFWYFPPEEKMLMIQFLCFSLVDLVFGLLFGLRIAFAGKEREEHRGGP
jgi:hypothetical protein